MDKITFKHDKSTNSYWASFSDKKSCAIVFYEEKDDREYDIVYSVAFGVGNSRKQILNWALNDKRYIKDQITGDGNLKYLTFAYNSIIQFEKYIKEKYPCKNILMSISAEDERRWKVYNYYLKKIGYTESHLNSTYGWSKSNRMYKTI